MLSLNALKKTQHEVEPSEHGISLKSFEAKPAQVHLLFKDALLAKQQMLPKKHHYVHMCV